MYYNDEGYNNMGLHAKKISFFLRFGVMKQSYKTLY